MNLGLARWQHSNKFLNHTLIPSKPHPFLLNHTLSFPLETGPWPNPLQLFFSQRDLRNISCTYLFLLLHDILVPVLCQWLVKVFDRQLPFLLLEIGIPNASQSPARKTRQHLSLSITHSHGSLISGGLDQLELGSYYGVGIYPLAMQFLAQLLIKFVLVVSQDMYCVLARAGIMVHSFYHIKG